MNKIVILIFLLIIELTLRITFSRNENRKFLVSNIKERLNVLSYLLTKIIKNYTDKVYIIMLPSLLYVLNYKMMSFNSLTMSESFAVFLLVLVIYFFQMYLKNSSTITVAVLSVIFGLLIITKPTYLYLVIPFEVFIIFHYKIYIYDKNLKR